MGDVPTREGRHGDDGDGASVGELYRLLVDLRQVGVERARHRVLGGDLVHTVGDDGQGIGVVRHVRQQHEDLLALDYGEVLGGRERHVGDEQALDGGVLRRVDEADDAV